jgi:hypothetical protein
MFALDKLRCYPRGYVVKGTVKDYLKSPARVVHSTFETVLDEQLEDSCVIFDDILLPSSRELKVLRTALSYTKRHKNTSILVLVHSLYRNDTFQLLYHADRVIFTKALPNESNFAEFARKFLAMPKADIAARWNDFMKRKERYLYLVCDLHTRTISYYATGGDPVDEKAAVAATAAALLVDIAAAERKRAKVFSILASFGDANLKMALFDHVFHNFPMAHLRESDLSISLAPVGSSARRARKVSICDLVHGVVEPDVTPTDDCKRLFRMLSTLFCIPSIFVRNKSFLPRVVKRKRGE